MSGTVSTRMPPVRPRAPRRWWQPPSRFHSASFTRERIGFRGLITFVWYLRRGSIEAWCGRYGALRYHGRWYFTRTGVFVLGDESRREPRSEPNPF